METKPNELAFASSPTNDSSGSDGLTKREYFAARAMQGLLSNSMYSYDVTTRSCSKLAVEQADALIAELNRKKDG